VKNILRRCSISTARTLTENALAADTAEDVDLILQSGIAAHFSDSID